MQSSVAESERGAQIALAEVGIELYAGVSGDCDEAVEKLLAGTLEHGEGAKCSHDGGEHKCGHYKGEHKMWTS